MENKELYHHGVIGMKWGIRRTPAQLGHQPSSGKKRRFWSSKKKAEPKKTEEELDAEKIEKKREKVLKSRSARQLYENADLFSTQELQSAYTRLQLEHNIKNLIPKEVNKGERFVDNATKSARKMSDLLDAGTKAYESISRVRKLFGDDKTKPEIKITDFRTNSPRDMSDDMLNRAVKRATSEKALYKLIKELDLD